MTKPQRVEQFKRFDAACRANGWSFACHRLVIGSVTSDAVNLAGRNAFAAQVHHAATALAERDGRPVLDDDLRHAVYILATGKKSVRQLDSKRDTDRVFAWLALMADETNLDALLVLEDPEAQDRKRLIHRIHELAPDSYTRAIILDQIGRTARLEHLTLDELRRLVMTVDNRARRHDLHPSTAGFQPAVPQASSLVPTPDFPHVPQTTGTGTANPPNAAVRSTSLALPKLPAQNAAEPTPPAQSPSGAPGAAGATFHPVNSIPPSHEIPDDNCPF